MALRPCRECGEQISSEAKTCPKCGVKKPIKAKWWVPEGWLAKVVTGLFLLGVIEAVIGGVTGNNGQQNGTAQNVQPETEQPVDLTDAAALNKKYDIYARGACDVDAEDYLRSIAKYDYKWDDLGWGETKFDTYSLFVAHPGVLTLITHKVKLQNGFGAFRHIELDCVYDTQAKKVLRFSYSGAD